MSHSERVRQNLARYAMFLAQSIKKGKLNASAFDGLIDSFLNQPAYSMCHRRDLLKFAQTLL